MTQLQQTIEAAFERRDSITPGSVDAARRVPKEAPVRAARRESTVLTARTVSRDTVSGWRDIPLVISSSRCDFSQQRWRLQA